ncbi:MAG: molybdenum cofactor guanylyltransferase, partial [Methanosarcinales archaeon]
LELLINLNPNMKSAIILTGGKASRLGYLEKALIKLKNKFLIEYVIDILESIVDELIISVRDEKQGILLKNALKNYSYELVYDPIKNIGPLAGILSGLESAKSKYSLVIGCDMPFVHKEVINFLFKKAQSYDVAIPRWNNGKLEPLHAIYNKSVIKEVKNAINNKKYIILAPIFAQRKINFISTEEIKKIEPSLKTFSNINTLEDLKKFV